MVKKVKKAIEEALFKEFGDEWVIYGDSVTQGLRKPCFFVVPKKEEIVKPMIGRFLQKFEFEIECFGESGEHSEYESIMGRVFEAIGIVEYEKEKFWAKRREVRLEKGKMIFDAEYDVYVKYAEGETELMERLQMD